MESGQRERMAAFGEVLSRQVAGLSRPAMAAADRVGLGIMITHLAALPEVNGIAVYDAGDRMFAVAGLPTQNAHVFPAIVADEGMVLGTVRVMLAEEPFAASPLRALRATWMIWLLGWLATLVVCYLLARTRSKTATPVRHAEATDAQSSASQPPAGDNATASETLYMVLVVGGDAEDPARRELMAGDAMHLFRFVGDSHRAEPTLAEHGYQLAFADATAEDRAFEAVCAGLLIRRVLAALQDERLRVDFPHGSLRYALHVGTDPEQTYADAWLIASFARDGGFVISGALHDKIERLERLDVVSLDNRAAATLADPALARCYLVLDAIGPHRTVLDRYTEPLVRSIRGDATGAAGV